MSIHIYYDEQDPQDTGWAWRDEREGSPLGSGAIDSLVDDDIGCERGMVTIQDIGALYPAC